MGCGKKHDFKGDSCVCEVLRAIRDIQDRAVEEDCPECPTNCFLEPLGAISPARQRNVDTRVIVLKTKDGSPFHAFYRPVDGECVSIFFRVEEVYDNCCALLRVLVPINNGKAADLTDGCCISLDAVCGVDRFRSSNDCVTVDLSCFCAVQCIADIDLGICD